MDTTPNTLIVNAFPTPKEQIVNYALGLALTGTTLIVGFGMLFVAGKVMDARVNAKIKKNIHKISEVK